MKRVAVLTSGGDAPGMNAAIRAVVRTGLVRGWEMLGVGDGFTGLIAGDFRPLNARAVGGILGQAGTMLGSTRCRQLTEPGGQRAAVRQLEAHGAALIVIGGNGSQAGAAALAGHGASVVGVASTIDNDLPGIDITIGATTALEVALEAIDRLRATASSHRRAFLVEVMGRHCGFLALGAGIAGGAEAIVLPEAPLSPEAVAEELLAAYERGKRHAIVVVAEGAPLDADALAAYFKLHRERLGFDLRVTRLGHVQRGGTPGVFDRLLATRYGAAAVEAVAGGRFGTLVGLVGGRLAERSLVDVAAGACAFDRALYDLAGVLAQ